MTQEFLTRKEASKLLKIEPDTLHRWGKKGIITPCATIRGRPRYSVESVTRLLNPKPGNDAK